MPIKAEVVVGLGVRNEGVDVSLQEPADAQTVTIATGTITLGLAFQTRWC